MKIKTINANESFLKEVDCPPINKLSREVYSMRVEKLVERMNEKQVTHVIIYGDREHCANMEYFSGFDPRFEEALSIFDSKGKLTMIVGNEGAGYTSDIPYEVDTVLHQNFSMQGQPREQLQPLDEVLKSVMSGLGTVGIVGYKYYETGISEQEAEETYDIPANILKDIMKVCPDKKNFTKEITGVPNGIRMRLYCAQEIAWAESQGNRCAGVIQRMLKQLKIGMKEYELPMLANVGFDTRCMHPICNFGEKSVKIGLGSPGTAVLKLGDVCGLCYGIKGNLTSKVSIAAYGPDTCKAELKEHLEDFYYQHFLAVSKWYETVSIGVTAGELYDSVMDIIGDERFGVSLNPSHYIGTDEWSNATAAKGASEPVVSGAHLQSDIIASSGNPIMASISEDSIVVANKELREELKEEYPEAYDRITKRQAWMREVLNINISDEVLPMSNLNGVFFPFMLDCSQVFVK